MAQVFISYAREDGSFVDRLAADLKGAGLAVWQDKSSIGAGQPWPEKIADGIKNSQHVIVVLSPDSVDSKSKWKSKWVGRELLFAEQHNRQIIPLLYRPCEVPINLGDVQYIDVQGENYEKNFPALLKALDVEAAKSLSPAPVTPAKPPPGFQTRQLAIAFIGAAAIIAAAFFFSRNENAPEGTPTTVTPIPIGITFTPSEPVSTEPTPTDTATPTATPTPSPTPTDSPTPTPTPTDTPTPTATNELTFAGCTIFPPSASAPSIDGYLSISRDEWKDARLAAELPQGKLYYLNDEHYLYLLVDVTQDTYNDLYEDDTKSYDNLTIGFDVDRDNVQDRGDVYYEYSGKYVTFKSFIWSRADSRGCGSTPIEYPTCSQSKSGFNISPQSTETSHKFWELKIDLQDIDSKSGESLYALILVDRAEKSPPLQEYGVPRGFGLDGFCTYDEPIKIDLQLPATPTPTNTPANTPTNTPTSTPTDSPTSTPDVSL